MIALENHEEHSREVLKSLVKIINKRSKKLLEKIDQNITMELTNLLIQNKVVISCGSFAF